MPSNELAAIDFSHTAKVLRQRWRFITIVTGVLAVVGILAATLLPPVWEAEASIRIGTAYGEFLEPPRSLVKLLQSAAFKTTVVRQLPAGVKSLRADIVDAESEGPIAYLRITARARTATQARDVTSFASDYVVNRHAELFERAASAGAEYETHLAQSLQQIDQGLRTLASLVDQPQQRHDTALTLLVQTQMDTARAQQLLLAKELRDWKLKKALTTTKTVAIAPPAVADAPVWPPRTAIVLTLTAIGLALAVAVVALFD